MARRKELLDLKQQECKEFALDFNGKLDFWDMRYYSNMIEERKYSVDQEKLKEYFPIDKVTEGKNRVYLQIWRDSLIFFQVLTLFD